MKQATRQKTNSIIDIAMFMVMILLAIIGIVIRYTLIPGADRWVKYGQNVELTIWGMDRHDWGLAHLIVGVLLIGLLVLHLVFHWKQIICMIKKLIPNVAVRTTSVTVVLVLCTIMIFSPLLLSPKIGDPIYGKGQGKGRNNQLPRKDIMQTSANNNFIRKENTAEENLHPSRKQSNVIATEEAEKDIAAPEELHLKEEHTLNIRGYYTFSELAEKYNISAEKLKKSLGIPATVSNNERLGRVRRTCNFTMSDVEETILKLQGN